MAGPNIQKGTTKGNERAGELTKGRPVSEQRGGEEDALDRELGKARAKNRREHAAQGAPAGGALSPNESLSRMGSINDPRNAADKGSSGDAPGDVQGGNGGQMPSAMSVGGVANGAPELQPHGMPPRVGGPLTLGASRPNVVAANAQASKDPSLVMGGKFRRLR